MMKCRHCCSSGTYCRRWLAEGDACDVDDDDAAMEVVMAKLKGKAEGRVVGGVSRLECRGCFSWVCGGVCEGHVEGVGVELT